MPRGELDDLAQALYGVIAALNASMRRAGSTEPEVPWAVEQLAAVQERLTRASQD
ncbi:MAG TPA: hypothetical protein VK009_18805 [Chloroflexota bacterium]|nr:hypothetical protein [Chloroflexota bacterium]